MSSLINNNGASLNANRQSIQSKNLSNQAVDVLTDAILKAVNLKIGKLEQRIEMLEKICGLSSAPIIATSIASSDFLGQAVVLDGGTNGTLVYDYRIEARGADAVEYDYIFDSHTSKNI